MNQVIYFHAGFWKWLPQEYKQDLERYVKLPAGKRKALWIQWRIEDGWFFDGYLDLGFSTRERIVAAVPFLPKGLIGEEGIKIQWCDENTIEQYVGLLTRDALIEPIKEAT